MSFDGGCGGESPAGTTLTLSLDWSNFVALAPIKT